MKVVPPIVLAEYELPWESLQNVVPPIVLQLICAAAELATTDKTVAIRKCRIAFSPSVVSRLL